MGINYNDAVVVYNRYLDRDAGEEERYFGTRFDNVRVEFTQEVNQSKSGSENASVCLLKIPNDNTLSKPYIDPKAWKKLAMDKKLETFTLDTNGDFFVLVKKTELNLDTVAPVGIQESSNPDYEGGFLEYMKEQYGYVYSMNSFAVFTLIPYFQVGGR